MKYLWLAAFVVIGGCTSSGSAPPAPPRAAIFTPEGTILSGVTNEGRRGSVQIGAPADQVWAKLPEAFTAVGLEVSRVEPRSRQIAQENVRVRRIDGAAPNRYLDCGSGISGPFANTYDVYLTVRAQVVNASGGGGGAELHTQVEAYARDRNHTGNPLNCTSFGRLEQRLVDVLQQLLAA